MKTWMKTALAAVVVLLVGAAGIAVGIRMSEGGDEPSSTGSPAAPPSASSSEGPEASPCDETESPEDGDTLTKPPEGDKWVSIDGVATKLPKTSAGPDKIEAGIPQCFAPTAEGAVVAAYHFVTVLETTEDTAKRQDLLAAYTSNVDDHEARVDSLSEREPVSLDLVGFSIVDKVEAGRITVLIVGSASGDDEMAVETPMVWEAGTWKFDLSGEPESYEADNISGLVKWGTP